jgi:hypothetical protein
MRETLRSPAVAFLEPEGAAAWIALRRPLCLSALHPGPVSVRFRRSFELAGAPERATLTVKALRSAVVRVNGTVVLDPRRSLESWREGLVADVAPFLWEGRQVIEIDVTNWNGPAMLLARVPELRLVSGTDWEASAGGDEWFRALDADERLLPECFDRYPSSLDAFSRHAGLLVAVFLAVMAASVWGQRRVAAAGTRASTAVLASSVRWALIGAWGLLGLNNFTRLPLDFGFDAPAHLDYVRFVATRWSLPLATDGWQMFQSPLYYIVSAPLYAAVWEVLGEVEAQCALRLVPLACGALQVQLAYAAVHSVFPSRPDLQVVGTVAGGLLPMNLYASQTVGNEPLAALFTGCAVVYALKLLRPGARVDRLSAWLVTGALIGLAFLSKFSTVVVVPALLLSLVFAGSRFGLSLLAIAGRCGVLVVAAATASGWYYARNWIELGRPFVGGWDPSRDIVWWQEPGYRTAHDFLSFGPALVRPLFAAVHGFWDALYSSLWTDGFLSGTIPVAGSGVPWNLDFLLSGPVLGLLPALAVALGALRCAAPCRDGRRLQLVFASSAGLSFLVAIAYLFLVLPIYSTGKATYALGLLPALAVLGAQGFDMLSRTVLARALVHGVLACWALAAYAAYFVW